MLARQLKIFRTIEEYRQWRVHQKGSIGFVPTMGALHSGHASLIQESKESCDLTVLSIFVNPTQFGKNEDLSKYPRQLERDIEMAKELGVDALFCPDNNEIYPEPYSTFVYESKMTKVLCGKFRPGHFQGVLTVVFKLFQIVKPHSAFFGLKDAQQLFVIYKMVRDLNLDVSIVGMPTTREKSGLALSSRNAYLDGDQKTFAPKFYEVLKQTALNLQTKPKSDVLAESAELLSSHGFEVQYLEVAKLPFLKDVSYTVEKDKPYLLAGAVFLGKTRLIDNIIINSSAISRMKNLKLIFDKA